jgi:hypothetical protein
MTGRFFDVAVVCALLALGPVVGLGVGQAAAEETLDAPTLDSLRLEGRDAHVSFTDHSADETSFAISIWEPGVTSVVVASASVPGSPGDERQGVTRSVSGIPPGNPLCATVQATITTAEYPYLQESSPESNRVCEDPADAPSDVALENIRGKEELSWVTVAGQSPAYLVAFRNAGGNETAGIVVDISTSGVATLGDQAGVQAGWAAAGFSCVTRPPAGGETAALSCTGGRLKPGEQTNPAVIVRFTGPGLGTIHASISGGADANPGNNGTALNVRVA